MTSLEDEVIINGMGLRNRVAMPPLTTNYPLLFRFNGVEKVEGGQTREDTLAVSRLLAAVGVDALDASLIPQSSLKEGEDRRFLVPSSAFPKKEPAGANVELSAAVKEVTGIPVIAVGKLGEGDSVRESARNFPIDIVAIGRQMIADHDAAGNIMDGKSNEIVLCEECMTCFATIASAKPLTCKVNKNLPSTTRSA
jgi:2,4-dienoyl-CoA reductase-like NADH-dependent reductase (Old Yellow Enzyme family)